MSAWPENLPRNTSVALLGKHLGMAADTARWPACYQSLAEEIDGLLIELGELRIIRSVAESYVRAPEGSEEVVARYDDLCKLLKLDNDFPKTLYGYPKDWPMCPSCGAPAMDGKVTCGNAECGTIEANQ